MDGQQVKEALASRAEAVCQELLPGGKVRNGQYHIGSLRGEPGESLVVNCVGAKVGVWKDFASGEPGGNNLLDLWMRVREQTFLDALKQAKGWLGVAESPLVRSPRKTIGLREPKKAPPTKPEYVPLDKGGAIYRWLTQERGLSQAALDAYGVGQSKDGKLAAFPYFANGELVLVKYRSPDKKKIFVLPGGSPKCLFGQDAVSDDQQDLYLVEGELDALAMFDMDHPAVSVPFGAKWENERGDDPNQEWIDHDWDWLERFVTVWMCLDADEPGRQAAECIAKRLGRSRCSLVDWEKVGVNDPNEYLLSGADGSDLHDGPLAEATDYRPADLKSAADFRKPVWDEFFNEDAALLGDAAPWGLGGFRFRPAEVTVWTGYSKHGKTVLLNYLLVHLASQGRRSCICSLEMKPSKNVKNLVRMAIGKDKPQDDAELDRALGWMENLVWVYDRVGTAHVDEVLEAFEYAAKRFGVTHFVVDSLMRLNLDENDDNVLKTMMNRLTDFALEYDAHVHLVAHSKKPDAKRPEEKYWPTKHQVRGSVYVTNLAHNVVCVYRNKSKEILLANDELQGERREEAMRAHDAMFIVQANRETGEEPLKRLFFDTTCWQYRDQQGLTPLHYLPT